MNMTFTHFNEDGRAKMVEVTDKEISKRVAIASGKVLMNKETIKLITSSSIKKGDVLSVAQIAGIMGTKRTSDLIPMCHPLMLTGVDMKLTLDDDGVNIECSVKTSGKTGVEMEALTGVSIAGLTVYDMCKAVDKHIVITDIRLEYKSGGKSGDFRRS